MLNALTSVRELIKAHEGIEREVYLDFENSSPILPEVIGAMLPYMRDMGYGNPTLTHKPGWEAYEAIMEASTEIARYIKASPEELHFTNSETEANNLALLGGFSANKKLGQKIVISKIEPLSILQPAQMMKRNGVEVVEVPVDAEGFVLEEELKRLVDEDTVLVSVGLVNHEIGTIQPIKELVEIVKEKNPDIIFHTDASDAYGRVPFNVEELGVDMVTLCSYKIQGPRGVGALYVKEGIEVDRVIEGQLGTQRLWPGVENVPSIVGFQIASRLAFENISEKVRSLKNFRDRMITETLDTIPETLLNGPKGDSRAPDNVNLSFLHCEGEALTIELSLKGIYVSSGSACTRRILQPSHVLVAIGRKYEEAHGSILMKLSSRHSKEDIQYVLKTLPQAVGRLRSISPSMGR